MDPSLSVAIVGAIGSVVTVVIANRFTTRSARKAQERTVEIEKTKVDAQAYERARQNYDAALAAQEKRIQGLQQEMAEDREEYRGDLVECRRRISELESRVRVDQVRIHSLVRYMRTLIQILRQHDISYPLPPEAMDL